MMKKTILCKRILGLFIFTFVLSGFWITSVSAKVKCENYLTNVKYLKRYNVSLEESENDESKYVLKLSPNSSDSSLKKALRKVEFSVISINGVTQNGSMRVKYGKPLTLSGQFVRKDADEEQMEVTLQSVETNADPKCEGKVLFKVSVIRSGSVVYEDEDIGGEVTDEFGAVSQVIDCSKPQTQEFEKNFCEVKNMAYKNGKYYYDGKFTMDPKKYEDDKEKKYNFSDVFGNKLKLKCDVNKFQSESDYYVNKTYMYGSNVITYDFGHYLYHYTPDRNHESNATKGDSVKCKIKCEEALVVEYGPPVASKAGLCFEYKVKVTSRVSCGMVEKPKKPKTPSRVCTPTPLCTNSAGTYLVNQGGPNEEFDECIKDCDGGKYTDKCSDKCYKKVYGKSSKSSKTALNYEDYQAEKLSDVAYDSDFNLDSCGHNSGYGGCYYRSGSSIHWSPGHKAGRWYRVHRHKDLSEYRVKQNGIYYHLYSDGSFCSDHCWWSGCRSKDVYLNPGVAKKDKEKNKKKYDQAVAKCQAKASCVSTTADFVISVKYKDGKKVEHKINFPYTSLDGGSDKDYISSKGPGNDGKNTSSADNSTILGYDGCYKDRDAERIYQTEWSFPGSWINYKTGEVSYKNKDKDSGWQTLKEKFCIPLDAQDVNVKWWKYYYTKVYGDNPSISLNGKGYSDECGSGSGDKDCSWEKVNSISEDDISWNIDAETTNFGYYGWNINIKCFYALATNPTKCKSDEMSADQKEKCVTKNGIETGKESAYRVRSVDLENLFPNKDGAEITDPNTSGRAPGFNWSEYSEKTKTTSTSYNDYPIKPSKYAATVQQKGYNVYSDEYLDYSIDLTRKIIAELKQTNGSKNYASFDGSFDNKDYVINYRSPLFTGVLRDAKHPNSESIICNNMKNYHGGCEN